MGITIPRPTDEDLARCYGEDYAYGAHQLIETEKRWRSGRMLDWADVKGGRLVDVGCMFGYLLDEARARGAETWGVELSGPPAEAAAERGHKIDCGTIEEFQKKHPDTRFDVIVAQHVLEHVTDPGSFLDAARAMLRPSGRLALAVPNMEARVRSLARRSWGWYQVPVHVYHFGKESLRRLLEAHGLRVTRTATRGGDSLFVVITALQSVGVSPKRGADKPPSPMLRAAFRVVYNAMRPFTAVADDELMVLAERV